MFVVLILCKGRRDRIILNICRVFLFQKIILQLIQVHKETDLMETMEVKYFLKLF
jgi:hypothetical protein